MARHEGHKAGHADGDMPRDRKLDATSVLKALVGGTDKATLQNYFSAFEWRKIADILDELVEAGQVEVTAEGWRPSSSA